jgi:hypothetical protein
MLGLGLGSGKPGKDGKNKSSKGSYKTARFDKTKAIASAVEKKVAEKMKEMEQEKSNETDTEAYIMSLIQKCTKGTNGKVRIADVTADAAPAPSIPTAATLKSIVKRSKNPGT